MRDFRDLIVWRRSNKLTLTLYRATAASPKVEMFALTSQIRRAATFIPTNLAEGCGRWGDGDMGRFLQIAMGSASELEYLLSLAKELGYLPVSSYNEVSAELAQIRRMLTVFYKRVRKMTPGPARQAGVC